MWLDYAEDQAKRRKQVFLRDWESKLNDFLAFNDRRVLPVCKCLHRCLAPERLAQGLARRPRS
jgi:hypothetical protein